jgi:hypothetical protein
VTMTVVNRTGRTLTASISSRLLMRSGEIPLTIPVTAAAGQTVTITVVPPELGRSDLPLGVVVDDGVPF